LRDKRESINEMAALVATVSAGSFSRAAIRLEMTPSGVSKLVARLERRLGVQLLQRTTRTMQLTEAGVLYHDRAERVLEDIDEIERDLEGHHLHPRGRLRVTAPTVLGEVLIMPVIIAYQRRYPDVTIAFDLTDRLVDFVAEGYDVAIRMTDQPPESFVARRLADDIRQVCASPGYLRKHRRPERPDDLANHRCIPFLTPTGPTPWNLRRTLDGPVELLTFKSTLELNNISAVHQAALAGLGIADLPGYLIEEDLAAGRLVSLLGPYISARRTIYAIYLASRLVPAKTRAFLKVLETSFKVRRSATLDDDH
jgi:LysR family transcriptional regulator, transcriptional activator for dmlA